MKDYIASTSRDLDPFLKSWVSVVYQEGKSVLDSELNLTQSLKNMRSYKALPSGMVSEFPVDNEEGSYVFYGSSDPLFQPNTLTIRSFLARVAGQEVFISGTASSDPTLNHISLPAPSTGGQSPDIKRTDFVFLEVWKALVTPSSSATGHIRVLSVGAIVDGDTINLDGSSLAGGGLIQLVAGTDFSIGVTEAETARNISDAINLINPATLGVGVTSETRGTEFAYLTFSGGVSGNQVALSTTLTNVGSVVVQQPIGGTDGSGIPQADKIYYAGNTDSDSSLYFDEDLRDALQGEETTKRVQLQYRLRVYSQDYDGDTLLDGVDPKTQPFGFENQNVLARGGQTAPVNGYYFSRANGNDVLRTDGNTNSYPYTDTGLYFTGDGSEQSASDLGSVDGYVYAIPICFVFRRNEGLFDPALHVNDGALSTHGGFINSVITANVSYPIPVGSSDRPDGLFADQVAEVDVLDLRRRVFVENVDYSQELMTQFQRLLDNQTRTWAIDGSDYLRIGSGSGDLSTQPLICDEIGRSVALGGDGDTTNRGNFIRNFDRVCTRFSDAPVVQKISLTLFKSVGTLGAVTITSPSGAGFWYEDDEIEISFDSLDIGSGSSLWFQNNPASLSGWLSNVAPQGTQITDVYGRHESANTSSDIDKTLYFKNVSGLGTNSVTLVLDRNQTLVDGGIIGNGTQPLVGDAILGDNGTRTLTLTFIVEYPQGQGLSATPSLSLVGDSISEVANGNLQYLYGEGSSAVLNEFNVGGLIGDVDGFNHSAYFREGSREVALVKTITNTITAYSDSGSQVYLPVGISLNRNNPVVSDTSNGIPGIAVPLNLGACVFGANETTLVFQNDIGGQRRLEIEADFLQAWQNDGHQISVYYRASAPQTCGVKADPILTLVPSTLTLKPLAISDRVWSIQTGSGSSDDSYPYSAPSVQIGVHTSVAEFVDESSLQGSSLISLDDFEINAGLASIPSFLPIDGTGNFVLQNPVLDVEARVVYEDTSDLLYKPSSYAKGLRKAIAHKNAVPLLARVQEDSTLYRRGEIVLVVISRYSEAVNIADGVEASKANLVQFSASEDRTVACVYRTQNLLLSGE